MATVTAGAVLFNAEERPPLRGCFLQRGREVVRADAGPGAVLVYNAGMSFTEARVAKSRMNAHCSAS